MQAERAAAGQASTRWPLLARLPTCLAGLSALIYFLSSEGIRNHLLLLKKAIGILARHWQ
ncbi:hypothetical protein [Janthinobacterium sp.]|uniref:hypothetical protein n=1 Tax=Janthinobacterium sp. TaxID=1871054 RepID=UPI00293D2960|nr:hypothetical protein [Janthinobacterium sp.]